MRVRIKSTDSNITELHNLKGGSKSMWLRIHRQEILEFKDRYGQEAAMRRYGITRGDVLEGLVLRGRNRKGSSQVIDSPNIPDLLFKKPIERHELGYLKEDISSLRAEVRELKRLFSVFQDTLSSQIAARLLKPLMSNSLGEILKDIDLNPHYEYKNPLKIDLEEQFSGARLPPPPLFKPRKTINC